MGYYMYYFQPTERDAYLGAEQKTGEILNQLTEKYGKEFSFEQYTKSVETTGFQIREQEAIKLFNNPNFKMDLSQVLQNQYFGTDKSVDPRTETMVKAEMIVSYNNLEQDFSMNKEEHIMSFDPTPVSNRGREPRKYRLPTDRDGRLQRCDLCKLVYVPRYPCQ